MVPVNPTTAAPPPATKLVLAVNSTVAFVGAFTLTTLVHELGHFLSYLAFGAHPVLYFSRVEANDSTVSMTGVVVSAMAGPVVSLVQGLVCAWWVRRRRQNRRADLFVQWLALFGFITIFGYLMLTPLSSGGDTGKAARLLGFPTWLNVVTSLAGIALMLVTVIRQDRYFGTFLRGAPRTGERAQWINALVFFPILAGSVVNVVFAFPIPAVISVVYPATSSLVVLAGFSLMHKVQRPELPASPAAESVSLAWVAVAVGLLVINRLLVYGM